MESKVKIKSAESIKKLNWNYIRRNEGIYEIVGRPEVRFVTFRINGSLQTTTLYIKMSTHKDYEGLIVPAEYEAFRGGIFIRKAEKLEINIVPE